MIEAIEEEEREREREREKGFQEDVAVLVGCFKRRLDVAGWPFGNGT